MRENSTGITEHYSPAESEVIRGSTILEAQIEFLKELLEALSDRLAFKRVESEVATTSVPLDNGEKMPL